MMRRRKRRFLFFSRKKSSAMTMYSPEEDHRLQKSPATSSLFSKIKGLKSRSQNWSDDDLKEIVEVVNILNEQLLNLSNSIHGLKGNISTIYGLSKEVEEIKRQIDSIERTRGGLPAPPRERTTQAPTPIQSLHKKGDAGQKHHTITLHSSKESAHEVPITSHSMVSNLTKEKLEHVIKGMEQYMKIFEEALEHLDEARGEGKKACQIELRGYEEKLAKLKRRTNSDSAEYEKILEELTDIPLTEFACDVCILIEEEIDKYKENKNVSKRKIFESRKEDIITSFKLKIINPIIGQPYDENECDILENKHTDKRENIPGTIYKVHKRGCRKGEKVIRKAKVSIE